MHTAGAPQVASSKDAVRKKLIGIATEIQATDLDEVDYQEVLAKVSSGKA
jgi:cofilin